MSQLKKKFVPYYEHQSFFQTLSQSAKLHGYQGKGASFIFFILKWCHYFLSLIAYFFPLNSIRIKLHRWRGVKIGKNCLIGFHCMLDEVFPEYITLEDEVILSGKVTLLCHSRPPLRFKPIFPSYIAPIQIKKGAWITINVTILPGVTIGEGSVITAGSVVTKDIPPNVIAGGNPAKVIQAIPLRQPKKEK